MHGYVDLVWIPLGAGEGASVVRVSGRAYERVVSTVQRRPAVPLFHSALVVGHDGAVWAVEMAPEWSGPPGDHGAVATGPVGMRGLGRWRLFRYEVRCWRDGVIPDLVYADGPPLRVSADPERARLVVESASGAPCEVWGRDHLRVGDMWNSNSLVSWLLATSGHDAAAFVPPRGGRAPGWAAGLAAAR